MIEYIVCLKSSCITFAATASYPGRESESAIISRGLADECWGRLCPELSWDAIRDLNERT
jgi:hypothetical protein